MAYVLIYRDISNGKIKSRFNDIRELCRFFKMLFYLHLVEANLTQFTDIVKSTFYFSIRNITINQYISHRLKSASEVIDR
jgi:hypothetical protein